ncbi:hypothetical protein HMPREF0742_01647 [Rothia aeria F0184]|uniref:Uncharacterized protein n=1 Tax=Rothia aeria F0184 TaxID=888019 RepID=U7V2F8_9MICC|nr:hypothetical protein HMPREF0742_01647 [Rothia aeria F0184]
MGNIFKGKLSAFYALFLWVYITIYREIFKSIYLFIKIHILE